MMHGQKNIKTCTLLHCLVHAATNQLCIVASTNTYPSAQHATFKPRTWMSHLRNNNYRRHLDDVAERPNQTCFPTYT